MQIFSTPLFLSFHSHVSATRSVIPSFRPSWLSSCTSSDFSQSFDRVVPSSAQASQIHPSQTAAVYQHDRHRDRSTPNILFSAAWRPQRSNRVHTLCCSTSPLPVAIVNFALSSVDIAIMIIQPLTTPLLPPSLLSNVPHRQLCQHSSTSLAYARIYH